MMGIGADDGHPGGAIFGPVVEDMFRLALDAIPNDCAAVNMPRDHQIATQSYGYNLAPRGGVLQGADACPGSDVPEPDFGVLAGRNERRVVEEEDFPNNASMANQVSQVGAVTWESNWSILLPRTTCPVRNSSTSPHNN
jgi:hypothetical protein